MAEEEEATEAAANPMAGPGGLLARQLSGIYSGFQEEAGVKAGTESGEPWQVAFRAAAAAGEVAYHICKIHVEHLNNRQSQLRCCASLLSEGQAPSTMEGRNLKHSPTLLSCLSSPYTSSSDFS